MLLCGGNTTVFPEWALDETSPPAYVRVYRVHGGVARYADEYERRELETGRLYILPSAAPYRATTDPAARFRCTFVHLDIFPSLVGRLISLSCGPDTLNGQLFSAIESAYTEDQPQTVFHLAAAFEAHCRETGVLPPPMPLIADVHDYIAAHCREQLSIKALSAHFGYNEQYFIRLFKADTGITPHQYILNHRLNESMRLLKGDDSISLIAEQVGFKDAKTFCRAFARRYGVSPGRFRRYTVVVP